MRLWLFVCTAGATKRIWPRGLARWRAAVSLAALVMAGSLQAEQPWVGVVLPLEAIDVAAQTAGRLEAVLVRAGEEVEADAPLARIDSKSALQDQRIARAELQMAEAELARSRARARQEASRLERRSTTANLWSEEELALTEVEARSAEAESRAAQARVEKARATVEQLRQVLEQLEVRAPFAGHVSIRYLDPGAVVGAGTRIVRLVSNQALLVRFAVPPEQIGSLALGDAVAVTNSEGQSIGRAVVRHVSPEIDLASQRIFAEAILDRATLDQQPKGGLGVYVRRVASQRGETQHSEKQGLKPGQSPAAEPG